MAFTEALELRWRELFECELPDDLEEAEPWLAAGIWSSSQQVVVD